MTDNERVLADSVPLRHAATVMLLRDGESGLEVFMLQRTHSASFARGQYVFPGGRVDDADHGVGLEPICDGLDDPTASAQLGLESGGLAWLVAAIRECFEEAGVLLARPTATDQIVRFDSREAEERFSTTRHQVHDGSLSLSELCEAEDLQLLTDRMHLVDHWITPVGERRRFDTRFFVAMAPEAQKPLHDDKETIASLWIRPADALEMWKAGDLQMFPPTIASLRFLKEHEGAESAIEAAAAVGVPIPVQPKLKMSDDGKVRGILLPGQDGYEDLAHPKYVIGY